MILGRQFTGEHRSPLTVAGGEEAEEMWTRVERLKTIKELERMLVAYGHDAT